MVQQVSYLYKNLPMDTILTLAGHNRAPVLLSRNIIQKRCYYATLSANHIKSFCMLDNPNVFSLFNIYVNSNVGGCFDLMPY